VKLKKKLQMIFVLIQFSSKTTKVLYAGQFEEKKAWSDVVKVMGRHG
jgi:hypothetical protein